MTELKTLKDLENVKNDTLLYLIKEFKKGKVNKNIITSTYFLKQEAIKWVKNRWGYAKKISDEEKVIRVSDLLNFFNLTEEEVK